jgi:hypothetical protein
MARSLFDHLDAICTNQDINYFDELDDADRKTFTVYMVNRFISMKSEFLPIVNEFQMYYDSSGPREAYLFYSQMLPKEKKYFKYIKSKKETKYEDWLVALVAKHYQVSQIEAQDYLFTFYLTDAGKGYLRQLCEQHCIESKLIKKAKI